MDPKVLSKDFRIFVDSGGYSARKNGVDIDIQAYGKFLADNKDDIFVAANLDVYDLDQAHKNQTTLEQYFPVIPVYHMSEYNGGKRDLLEEMCKQYKYIAIGGVAGGAIDKQMITNFFNFCFKIGLKHKTKFHGFGITSPGYLRDYPWYSVDSTTWMAGSRYGQMMVWRSGDYSMQTNIHYSDKEEYMRHNFDKEGVEDYWVRMAASIKEMLKMEKAITDLWAARDIIYDDEYR